MIRPVLAEIAGSWPSALQSGADVGGAAVLPDDGAVHGLAGGAVPHHGGLALVGDADRGDVLGRRAPAFSSASRQTATVEVQMSSGSCSTQPEAGKCCGNSACAVRGDGDVAAKHDGARGRGALIDGQHKGHDVASPGGCWLREGKRIGEAKVKSRSDAFFPLPLRETVASRTLPDEGSDLATSNSLSPSQPRCAIASPSPTRERARETRYTAAVVTPPSTTMVWPVMKVEASEAEIGHRAGDFVGLADPAQRRGGGAALQVALRLPTARGRNRF